MTLSLRVIGTCLMCLCSIVLPSLIPAQAAPGSAPRITVKSTAPRHWRMTIVQSDTTDVGAAQAMLGPRAQALCGDEPVRAGHYRFETTEALSAPAGKAPASPVMTLVQDIACGAALPPRATAPATVRTDADAAAAGFDVAQRYLAARNGGNVGATVALIDPEAGIADGIRRDIEDPRNRIGSPVGKPRYKITLYRDPPNAPGPGLYVAVDFTLEYQKALAVCGYVIAHEAPGGRFAITREERGVISRATAAAARPDELAVMRQKLLCNVP